MSGIQRAACWAQARRKLKEALGTGFENVATLLSLVPELFAIERPINERVPVGEIDRAEQLERMAPPTRQSFDQ